MLDEYQVTHSRFAVASFHAEYYGSRDCTDGYGQVESQKSIEYRSKKQKEADVIREKLDTIEKMLRIIGVSDEVRDSQLFVYSITYYAHNTVIRTSDINELLRSVTNGRNGYNFGVGGVDKKKKIEFIPD